MPKNTTVAPAETKTLDMPSFLCGVHISAFIYPGDTGGAAFTLSRPGALDEDFTIVDGATWELDSLCSGLNYSVKNTGTTFIVFTTPTTLTGP